MKKATSSGIYKVYNGSHLLLFGKKWQNFEISYENSSYYELSASVLTHFSPVLHFYTPWKLWFSDVFRGYGNVTLD